MRAEWWREKAVGFVFSAFTSRGSQQWLTYALWPRLQVGQHRPAQLHRHLPTPVVVFVVHLHHHSQPRQRPRPMHCGIMRVLCKCSVHTQTTYAGMFLCRMPLGGSGPNVDHARFDSLRSMPGSISSGRKGSVKSLLRAPSASHSGGSSWPVHIHTRRYVLYSRLQMNKLFLVVKTDHICTHRWRSTWAVGAVACRKCGGD